MKLFVKELFHQLTGRYSDNIIDCRSYDIIQYLKEIGYKGKKSKKRKLIQMEEVK